MGRNFNSFSSFFDPGADRNATIEIRYSCYIQADKLHLMGLDAIQLDRGVIGKKEIGRLHISSLRLGSDNLDDIGAVFENLATNRCSRMI